MSPVCAKVIVSLREASDGIKALLSEKCKTVDEFLECISCLKDLVGYAESFESDYHTYHSLRREEGINARFALTTMTLCDILRELKILARDWVTVLAKRQSFADSLVTKIA